MNTGILLSIPAEEYHAAARCGRYMSSHLLPDFWNIHRSIGEGGRESPPISIATRPVAKSLSQETRRWCSDARLEGRGSRKPHRRGLWTPTARRTPEHSRYGAFFLEMKDSVNPSIRMVRRVRPIRACITGYKVSELTEILIL